MNIKWSNNKTANTDGKNSVIRNRSSYRKYSSEEDALDLTTESLIEKRRKFFNPEIEE